MTTDGKSAYWSMMLPGGLQEKHPSEPPPQGLTKKPEMARMRILRGFGAFPCRSVYGYVAQLVRAQHS